jgi:hypothetical protein
VQDNSTLYPHFTVINSRPGMREEGNGVLGGAGSLLPRGSPEYPNCM